MLFSVVSCLWKPLDIVIFPDIAHVRQYSILDTSGRETSSVPPKVMSNGETVLCTCCYTKL